MSLRDAYVMAALQALVCVYAPEVCAVRCFEYADAMLAERDKGND